MLRSVLARRFERGDRASQRLVPEPRIHTEVLLDRLRECAPRLLVAVEPLRHASGLSLQRAGDVALAELAVHYHGPEGAHALGDMLPGSRRVEHELQTTVLRKHCQPEALHESATSLPIGSVATKKRALTDFGKRVEIAIAKRAEEDPSVSQTSVERRWEGQENVEKARRGRLSKLMRGHSNPGGVNVIDALALADLLGVECRWLFTGNGAVRAAQGALETGESHVRSSRRG